MRRQIKIVAALVGAALILASCGGSGSDSADEAETTTTTPPTTTEPTTTITEPRNAPMPLTGVPAEDEAFIERAAMIVKIDNNDRNARPQRGLADADIVIEEAVENRESRFFAIFHSDLPERVGPVRSARTSDIDLMAMFGRPTFSASGANAGTMGALRNSGYAVLAGHDSQYGSLFFRDGDGDFGRRAPHNLFLNLPALKDAVGDAALAPTPLWAYLDEDESLPASAVPARSVDITFGSTSSNWTWDATSEVFQREQLGTPHLDAEGRQVGAANVLMLLTKYGTSPFDPTSPEAISVGTGEAWLLTGGKVIYGSWSRPSATAGYLLLDEDGREMKLTPGQTWIELLRTEHVPVFVP